MSEWAVVCGQLRLFSDNLREFDTADVIGGMTEDGWSVGLSGARLWA